MGTQNTRGRKRRGVAIVSLLLAVLLVVAGITMSASAGLFDKFQLDVYDSGSAQGNEWVKSVSSSTTVPLNLFTDEIFSAKDVSGVKCIKVTSDTITKYSDVQFTLDEPVGDSNWDPDINSIRSTITYSSRNTLSKGDINGFLARIGVAFKGSGNSGTGSLKITAYSNKAGTQQISNPYSAYNCSFRFYSFAEGAVVKDSVKVDYKGDYEEGFNTTGAEGRIPVVTADEKGGMAEFKMRFTSFGGIYGAKQVVYGYEVKKSAEAWSSSVATVLVNEDSPIETSAWTDMSKTVTIQVPLNETLGYLEAGTDYDIRGIIISDGKKSSPKYTEEFTVRYDKPQINSFNVGNTSTVWSGRQIMDLSMAAVFGDRNYVNKTYTDINGEERFGPALQVKVYFTPDRNFTEEGTMDDATWYELENLATTENLQTDDKISTTFEYKHTYTLPETMGQLDPSLTGAAAAKALDSQNCAFKIVLTDLATGYSVYDYSAPFTVDSTKPTGLTVTGSNAGGNVNLDLTANMRAVGGLTLTIGGATDDTADEEEIRGGVGLGKGSGIKQYMYSMYYLSTDKVNTDPDLATKSITEVLNVMKDWDETTHGNSEYSPWAGLQATDNFATLPIEKDGFYRIDVKATDNSGKDSEIQHKYLRVDLTGPSKPVLALAQGPDADHLSAYDNRTYTENTVWLLAYSEPLTGKMVRTFQYSTNGRDWIDIVNMTKNPDGSDSTTPQVPNNMKKLPFIKTNADGSVVFEDGVAQPNFVTVDGKTEQGTMQVSVYDYNVSYTDKITKPYHAAVNLSGMGLDDYNAIQVRAVDGLGNVSLVSDIIEMRTIGNKPTPTSVLSHQDIELALAVGNTTMETSTITADIKNAAAKKINAAYYGINSNEYKAIKDHTCTWTDSACTGECTKANCPYKTATVEYFSPEMVGVQGVSADPTDQSKFPWVRYDHSDWSSIQDKDGVTHQIATVAYVNDNHDVTNLQVDATQDTFEKNGKTYYTASKDRVVFVGQKSASAVTNGLPNQIAMDGVWTRESTPGDGKHYNKDFLICKYIGENQSVAGGVCVWASGWEDSYNSAGRWMRFGGVTFGSTGYIGKRVYHMLDFSNATPRNGDVDPSVDLTQPGDMSTIVGINGYTGGSLRDWLFVYKNQPTKKEISFTIEDSQVAAHSADFWGFLFNCTIRPAVNKQSTFKTTENDWRISGYMFMIGLSQSTYNRDLSSVRWWIAKLDNISLEQFADGCLVKGGVPTNKGTGWDFKGDEWFPYDNFDDIPLGLISDPPNETRSFVDDAKRASLCKFPDGGEIVTVAFSNEDYQAVDDPKVRNFKLITEGNYTSLYVWNSDTTVPTMAQIDQKWKEYQASANPRQTLMDGTNPYYNGFTAVRWKQSYHNANLYTDSHIPAEDAENNTVVYTPRPSVDGVRVGTYWARANSMHTDTNCYGFGPIVGARGTQHAEAGCYADSRVVFSNVSLKMDVARTLSEVVNEPQWGGSSAKFIANISDDSTEDFADPVLSAQVQWRLFKDKAKFIGWGGYDNQVATMNFLDRIEGEGTFVANVTNVEYNDPGTNKNPKREGQNDSNKANYDGNVVGTAVPMSDQIEQVADYITREYYESMGYALAENKKVGEDTPVYQKAQAKVTGSGAKGAVYTMEEIENITLSVTPESYAASSANKDFPQGRWYIVHDTNGFGKRTTGGERVEGNYSDALDLHITEPGRYTVYFAPDAAKIPDQLDPDDESCIFDFVVNTPPEAQFSGSIDDGNVITISDDSYDPDNGKPTSGGDTATMVNGVPVSGVNTGETKWRTALLGKALNTTTMMEEVKVISDTGWVSESPHGKTVRDLTGKDSVASDQVLTVYQKVTDYNTRRVAVKDALGNVTGYTYQQLPGTVSRVMQQNLTSGKDVTYAPLSAVDISDLKVYNTASDDYKVTVSRTSRQTQGKPFWLSWAVDYDGVYRRLARDKSTNNYYLCSKATYDALDAAKKAAGDNYEETPLEGNNLADLRSKYGVNNPVCAAMADTPVLEFVISDPPTNPDDSKNGTLGLKEASDKWTISKKVIRTLKNNATGKNSKVVLQITETARGISQAESLKPSPQEKNITDFSARAIGYEEDKNAPSVQNVAVTTKYTDGRDDTEYLASNYLDVSAADRYINLNVGGSKDKEGVVEGYAYYFYDKNAFGAISQYYYMDASGNLLPATSEQDAVNKQAKKFTGPDGGDIKITAAIMTEARRPTYSVNVGIYAYDNGGNKAPQTRVEDIKLSTSAPVKPAITATNTLNKKVAEIGNDYGFNFQGGKGEPTYDKTTGQYKPNVTSNTDQSISELEYSANTNVTLKFSARQRKYSLDSTKGVYYPDEASQSTYYEDIYGRADLTGSSTILYTIERRETVAQAFSIYTLNGVPQDKVEIDPNLNVTLSQDGIYRVTAWVKNGAGTLSEANQMAEFTIDQTPPTGMKVTFEDTSSSPPKSYVSGTWSKQVTMTVEGATDLNATGACYMISTNNGETYESMGNGLGLKTKVFDQTGEYQVIVKAVDKAANESLFNVVATTVRIDKEAPTVSAPTVETDAVTTEYYSSYVVTLGSSTGGGHIRAMNADGTMNNTDTAISVETGAAQRFYIMPDAGYKIRAVTLTSKENSESIVTDVTDSLIPDEENGYSYYLVTDIRQDIVLNAEFVPEAVETEAYMVSARRSLASVRAASLRTALNEQESAEEVPETESSEDETVSSAISSAVSSVVSSALGTSTDSDVNASSAVSFEVVDGESGIQLAQETGVSPMADPDPVMVPIDAIFDTGGMIITDPMNEAPAGTPITCTMVPDTSDYELTELYVNDRLITEGITENPDTAGNITYVYTIPGEQVAGESVKIRAVFGVIPRRALKVSVTPGAEGTLEVQPGSGITQKNGVYQVRIGTKVNIVATPGTNYMLESLTVNGAALPEAVNHEGVFQYQYTMEAAPSDSEDTGVEIVAKFEISPNVEDPDNPGEKIYRHKIAASVAEGCEGMGTIEPIGDAYILENGTRQFAIYPYSGYSIDDVLAAQSDEHDVCVPVSVMNKLVDITDANGRKGKAYTFSGVYDDNSTIQAVFKQTTYKVETKNGGGGGVVGVTSPTTDSLTLSAVPEGTELIFTAVPKTGYKIRSMKVTTSDDSGNVTGTTVLGSTTVYHVEHLTSNISVEAEFEERVVNQLETAHSIKATANKVNDNNSLAKEPYRFRLTDGKKYSAWSDWSSTNSIKYDYFLAEGASEPTELKPNTQYTVEVQVRDVVGNISDPVGGSAYTRANIPTTIEARSADSKNQEDTKAIELYVNANGNPSDTEYQVFYTTSATMPARPPVANEKVNGGWATLDSNGMFLIEGMTPGLKYQLQVIARNKEGYQTAVNDRDIASVTLSPASPPANSFYFKEQASPTDGIQLCWDVPEDSSVEKIEIFRDGMFIAECPYTAGSYTDPITNFQGDNVYTYSYAFVNTAGTGSSRTAVSEAYHAAYVNEKLKYSENPEDHAKYDTELGKKWAKMEQLVESDPDCFTEAMTYPRFPTFKDSSNRYAIKVVRADASSSSTASGVIGAYVPIDSNIARYQKYYLGLRAYELTFNEDGTIASETDVTDTANWDHTAGQINKQPKETKVTSNNGAYILWEGLDTNYAYKVTVNEIRSTGSPVMSGVAYEDGYGGRTKGVEGTLGKRYIVNYDGFRTEYTKDVAATVGLTTQTGTWKSDDDRLNYTQGSGWNTILNMEHIRFNRSPEIEQAADLYAGNDAAKIRTDTKDGSQYLLVDQSMADMKFHLNAVVWDEDGSDNYQNSSVGGEIGGVTGEAKLEKNEKLPEKKTDALAKPYPVVFDGKGLATGVYTNATLNAYDGNTASDLPVTSGLKVVVNRTAPVLDVEGGTDDRLVQTGKTYTESLLKVAAGLPKTSNDEARSDLLKVRLMVLAEQYDALFDSHDLYAILNDLSTGSNPTHLQKAKEMLTAEYGDDISAYLNGANLNEEGVAAVLELVDPPIKGYFEITAEQYEANQAADPSKFRVETGRNNSKRYWVEQAYAFDNNLCSWLAKAGDNGEYKVTAAASAEDKHAVELVAEFGGNTAISVVYFEVREEPTVEILSKKYWAWTSVPEEEYKAYVEDGMTIEKVADKYKDCYNPETAPMDETTGPAYRTPGVNGQYEVYKLNDEKAQVFNDKLAGVVKVDTGVYPKFEELGIVSTLQPWTPTETVLDNLNNLPEGGKYDKVSVGTSLAQVAGSYPFTVPDLLADQTYFLRSYYKVDGMYHLSDNYVALTTAGNYALSYYGFEVLSDTLYERSASEGGYSGEKDVSYRVRRTGNDAAYGRIRVTAEYLMADEFGNIQMQKDAEGNEIKDESGNPIPMKITDPEQLAMAKNTFGFAEGAEDFSKFFAKDVNGIPASNTSVTMTLRNTDEKQGHMVVRLTISIVPDDEAEGYNLPMPGSQVLDIFIQDNESEVQSYRFDVENTDGTMSEVVEGDKLNRYEYQFPGLQVGYSSGGELQVSFANAGTGDLKNITAKVYTKQSTISEESTAFTVTRPNPDNLKAESNDTSVITISPQTRLEDGDYTGYVCLSAKNMAEEDMIWIKVRQVVGQSTLRGHIYVGPNVPVRGDEHTGSATIEIYSDKVVRNADGTFSEKPLYTGVSDEYGGYYEINNIKDDSNTLYYRIVVKRDGFLLYDGTYARANYRFAPRNSGIYEFNLRLAGGDATGDTCEINDEDFDLLNKYFNLNYDLEAEPVTQEDHEIRRCDYNLDGAVNALDRAVLLANKGKTNNGNTTTCIYAYNSNNIVRVGDNSAG